jgi:hypothetical protein
MLHLLYALLATARSSLNSQRELALENLALRQQLAILHRKTKRPKLNNADRAFWVALSRLWPDWQSALILVKPETVIGWHRKGFKLYWTWKSRIRGGRPPIDAEVTNLTVVGGVLPFESLSEVVLSLVSAGGVVIDVNHGEVVDGSKLTCSALRQLTSTSGHRAKRKAPSAFAKCSTSWVAKARFASDCGIEHGETDASPCSCSIPDQLNLAQTGKGRLTKSRP